MITYCETVVTTPQPPLIIKPLARPTSKQKPTIISSIEWLANHIEPRGEDESNYLTRIRESLPVLNLYREFFPEDWARSTKSPFGTSKDSAYYSEREIEFLRLVDNRIVPLAVDWYLEWEERCPFIPLMSACDWDYYYAPDLDLLHHAYQLAFALNRGDGGATFAWYCEKQHLDAEQIVLLETGDEYGRGYRRKLDYPLFKELCRLGDTPLEYLPLTMEITTYDTGNLLFDYAPEMEMPQLLWTAETLRMLERERIEAERMSEQVESLSLWLDAGGDYALKRERITRAVTLWNLSWMDDPTGKEAAREAALREARKIHRGAEADTTLQHNLFDSAPR